MNEWSTAAKISLCLILVAAIGFILTVVFKIAQSRAETESENLSGIVTSISESEFMRFKNREVTGEEIVAFVQQVKDKDVMVLVSTKPLHQKYGDEIAVYGILAKSCVEETDGNLKYLTVEDETDSEATTGQPGILAKYKSHDGYIVQLEQDINGLHYNRDYSPLFKEDSLVYVGNNIQFRSSLVYSTGGELLGVYFKEVR